MPKAKEQKGAEEQVAGGGGGMPAFKGTLSEEEIANVAAYVVEDIVGGKKKFPQGSVWPRAARATTTAQVGRFLKSCPALRCRAVAAPGWSREPEGASSL
jgi:hypothetical protein